MATMLLSGLQMILLHVGVVSNGTVKQVNAEKFTFYHHKPTTGNRDEACVTTLQGLRLISAEAT